MIQFLQEKNIHQFFLFSIILKGLNAIGEIIGGVMVLIISQDLILRVVLYLTQEELTDDPTDKVANFLINSAQQFSISSKHFIAFYLLSHGVIKLWLVVGLLKNKLWAYPASMAVFVLFIFYQIYRYFHTYSVWLLALTVFDIIIIWLVWHEYNYLRVHHKFPDK